MTVVASSEGEASWNTVSRQKKGSRAAPRHRIESKFASLKPTVTHGRLQEPPTTPDRHRESLQDIESTYARVRDAYLASPGHRALVEMIHSRASSHAPITRAVCLGNGPLHAPDSSWDARRTANIQTAAFLALVDAMVALTGVQVRCTFQEPLYTAADRAYLTATLGHQVVDDPAALDLLTEDSLVWGVHMYHSVYSDVLARVAMPAMLVCTAWPVWDALPDADGTLAKSLARLGEIHMSANNYTMLEFPPDEGYFTFCDTAIYWRRGTRRTIAMARIEETHSVQEEPEGREGRLEDISFPT